MADRQGWQAAAPVFEKRRGPFKAAALPHVTPVLSPLLSGTIHETEINQRRSSLDVLLRGLTDTYDQVTLQLHPSITDARPFAWAGWTVTPRYTHVADLTVDDPVAAWSKSVRYTIRTEAERFRIEEDQKQAEAGIALMEAGYERKAMALGLPRSTLTALVRRLAQDGLVRVFAATRDDDSSPEAVAIIAHDGQTAHYWIAGSKPGPAMGVLLADVVPRLKQDGITSLDFTGANVPSVAEFKRKYGTELRSYFLVRHVSHPLLRVLDRIRSPR
ncbi:MAG: GNAT family N-acetyltransferase [Bacteroidetes bacterium]|nr:GNAT family N-acetyltransferase [Bacteroidota bacterium]